MKKFRLVVDSGEDLPLGLVLSKHATFEEAYAEAVRLQNRSEATKGLYSRYGVRIEER